MKSIWLLAACVAALSGCGGIETAVRARAQPGFGTGAPTYAFAAPVGGLADGGALGYEAAVGKRLAQLGYRAAPEQTARYRIALSYDTRPADVAVVYGECAGGGACGTPPPRASGFPWPGAKRYIHSLTLRFFDRAEGRELYEVSVAKSDREPGSRGAIEFLAAGALARVPFADAAKHEGGDGDRRAMQSDWKVTLRAGDTDTVPHVTEIAPLPH